MYSKLPSPNLFSVVQSHHDKSIPHAREFLSPGAFRRHISSLVGLSLLNLLQFGILVLTSPVIQQKLASTSPKELPFGQWSLYLQIPSKLLLHANL